MKYLGPKTDGDDLATQSDVTGGGAELSDATPDAITPDQAGAAGTSTEAARADHSHAITANSPQPINANQSANSEGSSTSFSRADHLHQVLVGTPGAIQPDDSASAGSASSLARSDHRHSIAAAAPSSDLTASTTNAEGTSTSFARADHTHAIAAASAGTITGTNAEGSSTSFARADHNHDLSITPSWTAVTFSNSWVNYDATTYSSAEYYKDNFGFVHLRGLIKSGTLGAAAFTLPTGYRPTKNLIIPAAAFSGTQRHIDVVTNGQVKPATNASNVWFSLDGISFPTS